MEGRDEEPGPGEGDILPFPSKGKSEKPGRAKVIYTPEQRAMRNLLQQQREGRPTIKATGSQE